MELIAIYCLCCAVLLSVIFSLFLIQQTGLAQAVNILKWSKQEFGELP